MPSYEKLISAYEYSPFGAQGREIRGHNKAIEGLFALPDDPSLLVEIAKLKAVTTDQAVRKMASFRGIYEELRR